jgi:hypothetical protein
MATLNTPGPDGTEDARVVPLNVPRPRPASGATTPDTGPGPRPDTGPDDSPVLEGEVIRVDKPGPDRADWLADLAARTAPRTAVRSSTRRCGRAAKRPPPSGGWLGTTGT